MKTIIILTALMTGCATISEYNQGCRDGVNTFVVEVAKAGIDPSIVEAECNGLEALHKTKLKERK